MAPDGENSSSEEFLAVLWAQASEFYEFPVLLGEIIIAEHDHCSVVRDLYATGNEQRRCSVGKVVG